MEKIITYGVIALVVFGIFTGIYVTWKNNVKQEALNNYNKSQVEQSIKDQQKFQENSDIISKNQEKIKSEINSDNSTLKEDLGKIEDSVNSGTDRESSEVLKDAVRQLKALSEKKQ